MIHFIGISSFRRRLDSLLKVKRGVYAGAPAAICDAFKGASIEEIRQNRDMILLNDESIIIKLRMPDKRQRLSKADGYRLIYMVMKQVPMVALLDIYPKRGPSQQLDIDKLDLDRLIAEFRSEMLADTLVEHDINNNLTVIPK